MSNVSDLLDSVPKGLWLGGKLVPAEKTFAVYNPATGEELAQVATPPLPTVSVRSTSPLRRRKTGRPLRRVYAARSCGPPSNCCTPAPRTSR